MSVHKQKITPQKEETLKIPKYALLSLKGEAFRIYCLLLEMPDGAEISPKEIIKKAEVGNATVFRAFRIMKQLGFMDFPEVDGKIVQGIGSDGRMQQMATYEFFELPELNTGTNHNERE